MRCESSTRSSTSASSRWIPCREPLRRALAAALLLSPAGAQASEPSSSHPERVASYTLSVKLDASEHKLTGGGTIELVNFTGVALGELYLHLYMNAFKNDESLFLRSPFGAGRSGQHV